MSNKPKAKRTFKVTGKPAVTATVQHTQTLTLKVNIKQVGHLNWLVIGGLYGNTIEDAAIRLLDEGISSHIEVGRQRKLEQQRASSGS